MESEAQREQQLVNAVTGGPLPRRRQWWAEHISAGMSWAGRRRWARAERAFTRAAAFLPDEPVTYFNLGMLYEKTGQSERAIEAYEHARRVAPNFPPASQRLVELRGR